MKHNGHPGEREAVAARSVTAALAQD
jgi:hypothetical protein